MYRRTVCCCLVLGLLLSGCVTSLQPLVSDEAAIFDSDLIGEWTQSDRGSVWEFRSEGRGYRVIITVGGDEERRGEFLGRLTELDGRRYLDLQPDLDTFEAFDFYKWHLLATHSFMRMDVSDDDMELSMMNPQWLQQHLDSDPDAIATQMMNQRQVLSASTSELREFVAAYAAEPEFFLEPTELER